MLGWTRVLTHRQYEVWERWDREQWNRPSRADYYVMQNTAVQSKTNDLNRLKIPFVDPRPVPLTRRGRGLDGRRGPPGPVTKEQIATVNRMRAVAAASVGTQGKTLTPTMRYKLRDGTPCDEHGNPTGPTPVYLSAASPNQPPTSAPPDDYN